MGSPGVFEFGLLVALAFYGFLFWLAWTLVMSVKGIREEMSLVRRELEKLSKGGGSDGSGARDR